MPFEKWIGVMAVCAACGEELELDGDGLVAVKNEAALLDLINRQPNESAEDAITRACGCREGEE